MRNSIVGRRLFHIDVESVILFVQLQSVITDVNAKSDR